MFYLMLVHVAHTGHLFHLYAESSVWYAKQRMIFVRKRFTKTCHFLFLLLLSTAKKESLLCNFICADSKLTLIRKMQKRHK